MLLKPVLTFLPIFGACDFCELAVDLPKCPVGHGCGYCGKHKIHELLAVKLPAASPISETAHVSVATTDFAPGFIIFRFELVEISEAHTSND